MPQNCLATLAALLAAASASPCGEPGCLQDSGSSFVSHANLLQQSRTVTEEFEPSHDNEDLTPEVQDAKKLPARLPWCIAMGDSRAAMISKSNSPIAEMRDVPFWQAAAAINHAYALHHGYGFLYVQYPKPCNHSGRNRTYGHCKIAVVTDLMLHGINGYHCDKVLWLDTDAYVMNISMSLDTYLETKRQAGDESLQAGLEPWQLLFSVNSPWQADGLCTGIFWVRSSEDACGILRNWWDAKWDPDQGMEQAAMNFGVHMCHRAYGTRVRVMPTANAWHFNEGGDEGFAGLEEWDQLFHHGLREACSKNCSVDALPGANQLQHVSMSQSKDSAEFRHDWDPSSVFNDAASSCKSSQPREGVNLKEVMQRWPECKYLNATWTNLDGTRSKTRRPCWKEWKGYWGEGGHQHWSC